MEVAVSSFLFKRWTTVYFDFLLDWKTFTNDILWNIIRRHFNL